MTWNIRKKGTQMILCILNQQQDSTFRLGFVDSETNSQPLLELYYDNQESLSEAFCLFTEMLAIQKECGAAEAYCEMANEHGYDISTVNTKDLDFDAMEEMSEEELNQYLEEHGLQYIDEYEDTPEGLLESIMTTVDNFMENSEMDKDFIYLTLDSNLVNWYQQIKEREE